MRKLTLPLMTICAMVMVNFVTAQQIPKFDHVIFVLEENYCYDEVIGSAYSPTLTALSKQPYTVNFTQAFALDHPSEPNYLNLFSGSEQGVAQDEDAPDPNAPFGDCNEAASLIAKGMSFIGYSEDQPYVGCVSDNGDGIYAVKHCPWINWIGAGHADSVPVTSDVPFTSFPDSNHYGSLPTVAWVIPNENNDMHNNPDPSTMLSGDNWFKSYMMPLVRYSTVAANKTLVIMIFDEDDGSCSNNIPLLFTSAWVYGGNNSAHITHYGILKTIEDMYGLTECGESASATDVPSSIWNFSAGISSIQAQLTDFTVEPVPAKEQINVIVSAHSEGKANLMLYDITGKMVKELPVELTEGNSNFIINTEDIANGVYNLQLTGEKLNITKKVVVEK